VNGKVCVPFTDMDPSYQCLIGHFIQPKLCDVGIILHVHTKTFHNFLSTWYILTACVNDCTMLDISTRINMAQEQSIKHHRLSFLETSLTFHNCHIPNILHRCYPCWHPWLQCLSSLGTQIPQHQNCCAYPK